MTRTLIFVLGVAALTACERPSPRERQDRATLMAVYRPARDPARCQLLVLP